MNRTRENDLAAARSRHLRELVRNFQTAMLVTRTEGGAIRSRPLAVAECRDDGTLCFATSLESGKVHDVEDDPQVNVTLQNDKQYVSLSGRGEILRDRALVDRLWSDFWKVWFPEGKDDPSICILAVHPESAEFWDNGGAKGVKYLFEAARAYVTGRTPRSSEEQNARLSGEDLTVVEADEAPATGGVGRALAAGLSGALVLNLVHEGLRQLDPEAPRMDQVGSRGLNALLRVMDARPLQGPALYLSALGGDLAGNTLYYSLAFAGGARRPWTRGLFAGALAGAGAVILPARLGLQKKAPSVEAQVKTVGWYVLGGLAAAAAHRLLSRRS
jgi:general stress protein 26